MIIVVPERCPQNHKCPLIKKCKQQAIGQEGLKAPTIDYDKCVECMICVKNCPNEVFEEVEEEEKIA